MTETNQKTEKYEKELIAAIKRFKWVRWSHIDWDALSFSRKTAYIYRLHESDTIKEALEDNRMKAVNYMLQKWIASDNATLQIAAMKICADDEDRMRLNQQNIDHTTGGKEMRQMIIVPTPGDKQELESFLNDNE